MLPWPCRSPGASGDWASLPGDIVQLVTARLLGRDAADYVSFRAVCSGWRACTGPIMDLRRPEPWVALCDGDAVRPEDAREVTLFHTGTAKALRVRLPGLRGYRIVCFSAGLLVLVHKSSARVRVLHPFTRVALDFPSLAPVYFHDHEDTAARRRSSFRDMRAAVCRSRTASSSMVVVLWFAPVVVAAKPGADRWEMLHRQLFVSNALLFRGKLYATKSCSYDIVQLYPPTRRAPPPGPPAVVARVPRTPSYERFFLAESGGTMLLIIQCPAANARLGFRIYEVHFHSNGRGKLRRVRSLGDHALFLNKDGCLSILAGNLPSLCKNSIYSSEYRRPLLVHSLTTGLSEILSEECQIHDGNRRIRPSVRPFTIADHLLTFCHPREWTKGLMFHEYHVIPESFTELWKKIKAKESQLRIPPIPSRAPKRKLYYNRKNLRTRR